MNEKNKVALVFNKNPLSFGSVVGEDKEIFSVLIGWLQQGHNFGRS
jgi:hypothetical protein